ncbi:MAG: MBL fold metallo-hydrolase [Hyphomonadaceae bacterium]
MNRRQALAACAAFPLAACATRLNTHETEPSDLGTPVNQAALLDAMTRPGAVRFEKIVAADWHFPHGVRTEEAGEWTFRQLEAQIYFYAVRHPTRGLYLIDAGMPADYAVHMGPLLRRVVARDYELQLRLATERWTAAHGAPRAVFVTHLHYDHVLGVAALSRDIPVYLGPGDGGHRSFFYRFINQPTREALAGRAVRAWRFATPAAGELAMLDVFGDGAVFALHVPGHTPGSTAYLVNAADGPQLVTGDAVHSREAWTGELIEANGFEADLPQVHASLAALQALAARIPGVVVHPGHQSLAP